MWTVVENGKVYHINAMHITLVEEVAPHKTQIRLACGKQLMLDMDHTEFLESIKAMVRAHTHEHDE